MYRIGDDEEIYGVLMDYDLSSWTKDLTNNYTKTSQQRTGTPPFMAYELLDPQTNVLHLYRHDLESLFYIMLILATSYEIEAPTKTKSGGLLAREDTPPYKNWFGEQSYGDLYHFKHSFLGDVKDFDLSPTFWAFGDWLAGIHRCFRRGFGSKADYKDELKRQSQSGGKTIPQFDDETLGGHVCYSTFIDLASNLTGRLSGLIVRYKGKTSNGATQADA